MKLPLKKILGISFIFLGILGLFLPILQGILFLIIGFSLLEYEGISKYLKSIKRKKKPYNPNITDTFLRYLLALILVLFSLPLIYFIFTPLTITPVSEILGLFYSVQLQQTLLTINSQTLVSLVPSCIAGSAYILLLILSILTPMRLKKRIYSLIFSLTLLLILNILRIVFLSILLVNNFQFFDFTHKLFWYVLSTLFVVGIWFFTVKLFSIKSIPVYTDIKPLLNSIKNIKPANKN